MTKVLHCRTNLRVRILDAKKVRVTAVYDLRIELKIVYRTDEFFFKIAMHLPGPRVGCAQVATSLRITLRLVAECNLTKKDCQVLCVCRGMSRESLIKLTSPKGHGCFPITSELILTSLKIITQGNIIVEVSETQLEASPRQIMSFHFRPLNPVLHVFQYSRLRAIDTSFGGSSKPRMETSSRLCL